MRIRLAASCLALGACARGGPPAAPDVDATQRAPRAADGVAAIEVARDIDLYRDPASDSIAAHVDDGDVLERRDDGFTRVSTPHGIVAGYSAPSRYRIGTGIGLFVERAAPILSRQGTPIGVAHPGAFLPVVRLDAHMAVVGLAAYNIEGRVRRDSLTTRRLGPSARPTKIWEHSVENRRMVIQTGGERVETTCSEPIAVVAELAEGVQVAQISRGIEIIGIASDPGHACPARVVEAQPQSKGGSAADVLPAGFRMTSAFRTTALAAPRAFWIIERDLEGALGCGKWAFLPTPRGGTITHVTRWRSGLRGEPLSTTDTYDLVGARPVVERATTLEFVPLSSTTLDSRGRRPEGRGEGIALCGYRTATIVEGTQEGLVTLPGVSQAKRLLGYHPADVEVWYTRHDACKRALQQARERAPKRIADLLGPTTQDC